MSQADPRGAGPAGRAAAPGVVPSANLDPDGPGSSFQTGGGADDSSPPPLGWAWIRSAPQPAVVYSCRFSVMRVPEEP